MAFDDATRGRLQRFVTDARTVLTREFAKQFQQDYGLDPESGSVAALDSLDLDDQRLETARILREILDHYLASSIGQGAEAKKAVLDRMVREQAFTTLNRLAALRMMEARGLVMECVAKGYQSKAFQLYQRVAGSALGETGDAYRVFLLSLCDLYSDDLPALFDRHYPNGRLFPREPALLLLLDLVNDADIEPLWGEDETIGWIYQYFNSKEERKAMRDASQAPRNSRELAVRNQFFTPRYVVEFLVDNTLGRLWFNWTPGRTGLRDRCQYLLVEPNEKPEPAKRLRDPRTIKLLDPACGSMHFGLYAFDLFLEIYREAWTWEQQHGPGVLDVSTQPQAEFKPLCHSYADESAFLRDVPRLIIEHNIHGVDIDPRAAQIASLALWLRAQRAWHEAGVRPGDRPLVGRGQVVAAVAPPAEPDLRRRLMQELDPLDAELFEKTLFMLKGLPELGILLQTEKELPRLTEQVYGKVFDLLRERRRRKSWAQIEADLREALAGFAQAARATYRGRLFSQDALQGLRLVELIQDAFDVVVMNPPFGEPSDFSRDYCELKYPLYNKNLLCAFLMRAFDLVRKGGAVGAIYDRTAVVKNSYEAFRRNFLLKDDRLISQLDLGWGVLDANVEVTCSVLQKVDAHAEAATFIDVRTTAVDRKEAAVVGWLKKFHNHSMPHTDVRHTPTKFLSFPNAVLGYDFPDFVINLFVENSNIYEAGVQVIAGHTIKSDQYFRYWWEVPLDRAFQLAAPWQRLYNGGNYCRFISHLCDAVYYGNAGKLIANNASTILRNLSKQGTGCLGFGKRGDYIDAHVLPAGFVSSVEGQAVLVNGEIEPFGVLALINSRLFQFIINMYCGQHKYPGYVHLLPEPSWSSEAMVVAASSAASAYLLKESFESADETSPLFFHEHTAPFWEPEFIEHATKARADLCKIETRMNIAIHHAYGITELSQDLIWEKTTSEPTTGGVLDADTPTFWAMNLVHFFVGCAYGRWDIRLVKTSNRPSRIDAFEALPPTPPAWLGSPDLKSEYPIAFAELGILSEDDTGVRGFYKLVSDCMHYIYGDATDNMESLISRYLNHDSLHDYLSSHSGFFSDHFQKYAKGHRQAPIYWPVSTVSGNYTLWLYYPRLSNQTLYNLVNDFIEPKIKQVSHEASALRTKGSARSREDDRTLEALQSLEQELMALRDALLQIAPTYHPNHDDGVQITAAPLWPLFRHKPWQKLLKDTWGKLEKGDYDWAHLAMSYWPDRVREKCKTDKSLSIAHNLEHLYVEPAPEPGKARGRKKGS